MKCISLHEPYASLIALGIKSIETRGWDPKHCGPLAIHAAKRWDEDQHQLVRQWPFSAFLPADWKPALGMIVAVAHLADVQPMTPEQIAARHATAAHAFGTRDLHNQIARDALCGDWDLGRYAWILTDVRALVTPVAARGYQRLWEFSLPATVQFVRPEEVA